MLVKLLHHCSSRHTSVLAPTVWSSKSPLCTEQDGMSLLMQVRSQRDGRYHHQILSFAMLFAQTRLEQRVFFTIFA
jgi:hypothetical protein